MAAIERGWLGYLADRFYTWQNNLPSETSSYTIESLRIPIGNDLEVAANLYQTLTSPPSGTLLVRTPYGIDFAPSSGTARFFAARGYHVLLSACRGTSSSDGELVPGANEVADGHAVVEWMRKQPWYTSSFASLGGSYLGYTQFALLTDPPKDMKAAAIFTGPHDMYKFAYGTGAMYSNMVTWGDLTNRMKRKDGLISLIIFLRSITTRYKQTLESVPLLESVERYFAGSPPGWLRSTIQNPDRSAPYWQGLDPASALDKINIPVLLVTGWYDIIIDCVMDQYATLTQRGCKVRLVIGPWTHLGAQGRNVPAETLPWVEEHLAGHSSPERKYPVRVFITGKREWRELQQWPPSTIPQEMYLGNERQLAINKPTWQASESTFTFDPANPTPDTGAPLMFASAMGTSDQNDDLVARSDVLSWTSPALDAALEVCGKPYVELHHSTDIPYADILVVLSEVDTEGISRRLSERYLRLGPERRATPLQLWLHDIAHNFQMGTKIRLSVAGGSHPRYIRNLGSGEHPGTGTTLRAVQHTVQHHENALSRICLPVSETST